MVPRKRKQTKNPGSKPFYKMSFCLSKLFRRKINF